MGSYFVKLPKEIPPLLKILSVNGGGGAQWANMAILAV